MTNKSSIVAVNSNATQQLNAKYQEATGNIVFLKAIKAFTIISSVGIALSVIGSALGFYNDFIKIDLLSNFYVALFLSFLFAGLLDLARHHFLSSAIAFWVKGNLTMFMILISSAMAVTIFAVVMHVKGMKNYEQNTNMNLLRKIAQQEAVQQAQKTEISNKLINVIGEMTKNAYNNHDVRDDILVAKSSDKYASLVKDVMSSPTTTYATKALIKASEESSKSTRDSMTTLLPIIEVFTLVSLLLKLVLFAVVDTGAKVTSNMQDELNGMKENVYSMAQQMMMGKTRDDLTEILKLFSLQANSARNPAEAEAWEALQESLRGKYQQIDLSPTLPTQNKPKTTPNEEQEITENINNVENECEEVTDAEEFTQPEFIDPTLWDKDKAILIRELWGNGTKKVGQLLRSKAQIRESLKDTHSELYLNGLLGMLTKLNIDLKEAGYIEPIIGQGYLAKVEMSSVNKVV